MGLGALIVGLCALLPGYAGAIIEREYWCFCRRRGLAHLSVQDAAALFMSLKQSLTQALVGPHFTSPLPVLLTKPWTAQSHLCLELRYAIALWLLQIEMIRS